MRGNPRSRAGARGREERGRRFGPRLFIYHLRPKSSGHVTHESHNLQTKAINHSTRHYMNRRELESDQPIHVPLLRVLSFPPSDGLSALSP